MSFWYFKNNKSIKLPSNQPETEKKKATQVQVLDIFTTATSLNSDRITEYLPNTK